MRAITALKLTALLVLLAYMPAAAVKYVAVVESEVDAASGASADINPAEVRQITAELRRQATENLPPDRYNIMTSETVQSMGGAVLEECADENCVITLGSRIGADFIVKGTISRFGAKLTLSVEMYETDNGMLVITSEPVRAQNIEELLEGASAVSGAMYRKFAGTVGTAVAGQQNNERTASVYNNSLDNQYDDFSTGRRWGTWALNLAPVGVLPTGLGSFILMKDYVGGSIILGSTVIGGTLALLLVEKGGYGKNDALFMTYMVAWVGGSHAFNIYRSATYHKPQPKAAVNNVKPYDGLKFAVFPTESGDFKVVARYDYGF